jgi:uncharacterized protein YxjI
MKSFLIQQKITFLINRYAIYEAGEDGSRGAMTAFAEQKRFAFKEHIDFFTGEDKQQVAFSVQARQVIDFGARYDVLDTNGNILGTLGKNFKSSLIRSTWNVYHAGQEETPALVVQERSQALAVFRRIWQILPYLSDIPFFVKYHFDFTDPTTHEISATYNKTTTFRDFYQLDINGGTAETIDPRVLLALGVMMDALQSR